MTTAEPDASTKICLDCGEKLELRSDHTGNAWLHVRRDRERHRDEVSLGCFPTVIELAPEAQKIPVARLSEVEVVFLLKEDPCDYDCEPDELGIFTSVELAKEAAQKYAGQRDAEMAKEKGWAGSEPWGVLEWIEHEFDGFPAPCYRCRVGERFRELQIESHMVNQVKDYE